ncbi:MAG TPA: hypothetical protein VG733_15275 [Chthoniobacteraceae bacterium]|nr:hypothetical protein [Chthoniobacteraceae bacterium]
MDTNLATFLYKIASLASGSFVVFLGYKLFVKGIFGQSGDLETTWKETKIVLKKAAPGTFFSLFGAVVIICTIWKGLDLEKQSYDAPRPVPVGPSSSGTQSTTNLGKITIDTSSALVEHPTDAGVRKFINERLNQSPTPSPTP